MFPQFLPHLGIRSLSEGAGREGSSVVAGVVSHSGELFGELVGSPEYPPLQSADKVGGSSLAASAIALPGADDPAVGLSFQRALCHVLVLLGL